MMPRPRIMRWVDAHASDRDVAPGNLAGSQPISLGRVWDVLSMAGMRLASNCLYRKRYLSGEKRRIG
jgi:hypothetical protein